MKSMFCLIYSPAIKNFTENADVKRLNVVLDIGVVKSTFSKTSSPSELRTIFGWQTCPIFGMFF